MQLRLPVIQNWSCHNCSGCCRQHVIEVTEEEHQRILSQGWTEADGIENGGPVVLPMGRSKRLAHQQDGACIFLQDDGLCRIHAKFGEDAKPLACRVYPYTFHPAGKAQAVSLRFSCPTVVENGGRAVSEQRDEIKRIAKQVVPDQATTISAPLIRTGQSVDWKDFHKFVEFVDAVLETEDSILTRLLRITFSLHLIDESVFEKVRGERLNDYFQILGEASAQQNYDVLHELRPSGIGRVQFRMMAAVYSRRDTSAELDAGLGLKWKLLRAAIQFARGKGDIPVFRDELTPIPFEKLEGEFGGLPAGADEILTRYFRVKVQGLHFCGPAFYQMSFVDGLRGLILIFPVILWFARWLAAANNRQSLVLDDIVTAITIADHNHGFSGALGTASHRSRVRTLAKTKDIEKLCCWYCR